MINGLQIEKSFMKLRVTLNFNEALALTQKTNAQWKN